MLATIVETPLDNRILQAQELLAHLQAGEVEQADAIVRGWATVHEGAIFQELGRITRELHEAINGVLLDSRLQHIVNEEIPDAAERLKYVITMTEQAANTTLNAVETSVPLVTALRDQASELNGDWRRFRARQLPVDDFRRLVVSMDDFLNQVQSHGSALQGQLSEVLMAQDFQDLTGQIIRRVINMVHDVEIRLVQLIRISGPRMESLGAAKVVADTVVMLEGPAVPGLDDATAVQNQDDVDDLLSSLGF